MRDTDHTWPRSRPDRSVVVGTKSAALFHIRKKFVTLAVWERSMPPDVVLWLDQAQSDTLPTARFACHATLARPQVMQLFSGQAGNGNSAGYLLQEDIIAQVERFARICGTPWVDVRLEVLVGDACPKFHSDNVSIRLLTTYRGPGTEWLAPEIDPSARGTAEEPQGAVRRLPRFAVALIKGRKAESSSGPLILHRSPPIEGSGQIRYFCCVSETMSDGTYDRC